jgi:very-short-patch-repair endonuclease
VRGRHERNAIRKLAVRSSQPRRTSKAREFRSQPISAEAKLWSKLRDRRLSGLKFLRQAAAGAYFVDFLCRERKVVVEVDGGTHATEAEVVRDTIRAAELARLGYRVFRVSNRDVYDDIERVLDALIAFVENGD